VAPPSGASYYGVRLLRKHVTIAHHIAHFVKKHPELIVVVVIDESHNGSSSQSASVSNSLASAGVAPEDKNVHVFDIKGKKLYPH